MSQEPIATPETPPVDAPRPSTWAFFARFVRHPRKVGAVAPSSRYLARKMVHAVEWRPGVRIVEFGPGTGPFTAEILARLPEDGRCLGIERDRVFADMLGQRFPDADVAADSVDRLVEILEERELLPIDHVISGLPFASLPKDLIGRILEETMAALRPGGTFSTFQYLHAWGLPSARYFRSEMRQRFGPMHGWRCEIRNLPPAFVFTWRKPSNGSPS
jgi:phospholipid N-methyltransferase